MGYAAAIVVLADGLWRAIGARWFPVWWSKLPSLLNPRLVTRSQEDDENEFLDRREQLAARGQVDAPHVPIETHWLRLGYILILLLLGARLAYIAGDTIELSEDEAYQWHWSKHLALSYFSKPPLIAYAQFLGTSIWGDNAFGVRFLSPVVAAVLGFVMLRFFAREVNARASFLLLLVFTATPLLAAGSVLMTVDPWSVLFWTGAMVVGWKAASDKGSTADWLWVGIWMGFGFLSKYTQLFQLLCWALFFVLWPPARKHLGRPGPWLALGINLLFAVPVLLWNAQHSWITVAHVADNAGARTQWTPTLKHLGEFVGAELGLLNPVFLVGMIWAAIAFWKKGRKNPRAVYFFCMGAPVFIGYLVWTLRSRVFPNWIAPSVVPLFCLMALYWDARWRLGTRVVGTWLGIGLAVGLPLVLIAHDTNLVQKLTSYRLPVRVDPLRRVRGWQETARVVNEARQELGTDGTFIIGNHYGVTSQISFYVPEARAAVKTKPLVYCRSSERPGTSFSSGGATRIGWGGCHFCPRVEPDAPYRETPPEELQKQFETITDLGTRIIKYRGTPIRRLQLYACRGLRPSPPGDHR
jgi:hypothetical protein